MGDVTPSGLAVRARRGAPWRVTPRTLVRPASTATPSGPAALSLVPLLAVASGTAVALAVSALAPSAALLGAAALLVGLTSVVAQVLVPWAASLADDASRTRVVGTVMSGVLVGMLAARVVAGLLGGTLGWRVVPAGAAAMTAVLAVVLWRRLTPETTRHRRNGRPDVPYRDMLAGVGRLARDLPVLRVRALYGACGFGVFSGPTWASSTPSRRTPAAASRPCT